MLFPTDPNKRPELWPAFSEKVAAGKISFIVHSGERFLGENLQLTMTESADEIITSFRTADVVRFGASRGYAIGPFFAFNLNEGNARLIEYAVDSGIQTTSDDVLQEALQAVAINLFFERKDISQISLPIILSKWELTEWEASMQNGKTLLHRKE
jgi:hypothetical protein